MSMKLNDGNEDNLLFVGFNQDHGCFACGTNSGFIVYNCDPLKERFRREFEKGGIAIVEMLFRCNILALVGGGNNPKYPRNKVIIWDDYQNKCIAELEFRSEVKAVKLRRDRIVVVLQTKVYVYNFADLQLLDQIETCSNDAGLCCVSPDEQNMVLACPSKRAGFVHVKLFNKKESIEIAAHNNPLVHLALNLDGSLLATASEKGTLIRVFSTESGVQLFEFRRGVAQAEMYSIAFHPQSTWLCASSAKGTVHIYSLQPPEGATTNDNTSASQEDARNRQSRFYTFAAKFISGFSWMKDILPSYFSSEWSHSQFSLNTTARSICCFGQSDDSVITICSNGQYFKYRFEPSKPGEATKDTALNFLKEG